MAESDRWLLVTLTWPRTIEGAPERWKYLLKRFRRSWELHFKSAAKAVWVLEWQRQRAIGDSAGRSGPHFHLLIARPDEDFSEVGQWIKETWNSLVAPGDEDHLRRGAHIRTADTRVAPLYLARELGKKRQKELPPEHVAASAGRWWGPWGLQPVTDVFDVTEEEFFKLRRCYQALAHRRGFAFAPRFRHQGLLVFDRGARWSLFTSTQAYVRVLRGGPPSGSFALFESRIASHRTLPAARPHASDLPSDHAAAA